MFLARVEGSVVSTKKEASMNGRKLLLLRPQLVDEKDPTKFRPGSNTIVAVDCLGAGIGEMVMFCQGSSARLAPGMKDAPVDAVKGHAATAGACNAAHSSSGMNTSPRNDSARNASPRRRPASRNVDGNKGRARRAQRGSRSRMARMRETPRSTCSGVCPTTSTMMTALGVSARGAFTR